MTNTDEKRKEIADSFKKIDWVKFVSKLLDTLFIFGCGFALCFYGFQVDNVNRCNEFIWENYGVQTYYNGSDYLENTTPLILLMNGTTESIEIPTFKGIT